jgi:aminoglycoside phosphotransferase family enzyme/predicted kinase
MPEPTNPHTVEDQESVIEFLASPSTHHGASVDRIDTHTSVVFLAGTRAYKLKRAVSYDYVDFSTLDRRRRFCEAEVRLNRRTAPTMYEGCAPVFRLSNGRLSLAGDGEVVEWLVEMQRFDQHQLFDKLAADGRLDVDLMDPLASSIVDLHRVAALRRDCGGARGMQWVVEGNESGFVEFAAEGLDDQVTAEVIANTRRELKRQAPLLEERRQAGWVRECHGDLHLRNVVLLNGVPTLFDGVEFNDDISCIDVLYDLAFLLMDLWRRRLKLHANIVFNRYMAESEELGGLSLLPLFLSCRAAVRAKTSATAARLQPDATRRCELQTSAGEYLRMAGDLLAPSEPFLLAIGGFSGSGKSSVARVIAPTLGAPPGTLVLRSDEIRKRTCGVPLLQRLGPQGYEADVSQRVYETLAQRSRQVLSSGRSVIADAVFGEPSQRALIERVAADLNVPFVGCWLTAPEAVLAERVAQRRGDPSDADAGVIRLQHARGAGTIGWRLVDAVGTPETVLQRVSEFLADALGRR